jgi:hypothetical protein
MEELMQNPVELRRAVPTPHFDDRRAELRAQRVVPLDEIRTKLRRRRLGFLGGAFAIALMLGAASALLAIRVKRMTAGTETPQIEEPETLITAAAQPVPVESEPVQESRDEPIEQVIDEPTEAPAERPAKPIVTATRRQAPLAERPRIVGTNHGGVQPSEDEQLEQIREAVLYEQWQERRARRAARRERRNRAGDRDLSHLDEIFEGRRRSERP